MRILVPVNSADEMTLFNPEVFETEFFCGYMPSWWKERFNVSGAERRGVLPAPINNRNAESANVSDPGVLERMIETADRYQTDLFLAINAKHYPGFLYSALEKYIDEVSELGIRKVIACDEGLMHLLSRRHPEITVSVSCLNQVTNTWSALRMLKKGNVERIVFPRHMTSEEMCSIASAVPEMDFEFFIFSNKCPYDDGYCRGVHEFVPICKDRFQARFLGLDPRRSNNAFESFVTYSSVEDRYEEYGFKSPNFSCAACLLPAVSEQSNIVSAKIAFRGHSAAKKLWQVELAHNLIASKAGFDQIKGFVCSAYGADSLCDTGTACMC